MPLPGIWMFIAHLECKPINQPLYTFNSAHAPAPAHGHARIPWAKIEQHLRERWTTHEHRGTARTPPRSLGDMPISDMIWATHK